MINSKMLKEPLFLEFNSSGVLDRTVQAIPLHNMANTNNLVSAYKYSILKEPEDSNIKRETNNERETNEPASQYYRNSPDVNNDDIMCYLPCFDRDSRYGRIGVPNCFRGFGLNFHFLIDCFTD